MLTFINAPNKLFKHVTTNATTIGVVGMDGVLYATIAALKAAGTTPYPYMAPGGANAGMDVGMFLQSLAVRSSVVTTGADGSAFFIAFNLATAPADTAMHVVSGSGQTFINPGTIYNVWLRKTVGTDEINLTAAY